MRVEGVQGGGRTVGVVQGYRCVLKLATSKNSLIIKLQFVIFIGFWDNFGVISHTPL